MSQIAIDQGQQIAQQTQAANVRGARGATVKRILRQRSAVVGLMIIGALFAVALLADVLATHDPDKPMLGIEPGAKPRTPPCIHILGCPADQPEHFFGLDGNARDVYSRMCSPRTTRPDCLNSAGCNSGP